METAGEKFEGRKLKAEGKICFAYQAGCVLTTRPPLFKADGIFYPPPIPCLRHSVFSLQLSLTRLALQPNILIIRWHLQPKIGSIQHVIGEDLGKVDTHL